MTTSTDCRSMHQITNFLVFTRGAASESVLNTLNHPPTEAN